MVQTNTAQGPGGEAGVLRIKGTGEPQGKTDEAAGSARPKKIGLAMALDGNGRWAHSSIPNRRHARRR